MDKFFGENIKENKQESEPEPVYNRHYISTDDNGRITAGWSDGPRRDRDITGAICINAQGGYQFRLFPDGEENPSLYTMDGIPLYRWDGEKAVRRTEEEIAADRAAIPAPAPTPLERLEAQVAYTAMMSGTLLEAQ